jgi:tetraacyldisaccharide 4'-kinase
MRAPAFWSARTPLSTLLLPFGALFAAAGRLRRLTAATQDAPVPVICIGNLVAGGAGKTPVAIAVARALIERGVAAHFLSLGYGGTLTGPVRVDPQTQDAAETGDEPLLLAGAAPCWVAKDRAAGARAAAAAGAEVIVMDDGHQYPGLRKALSIVVVDGESGFGNGRVIPAGPLREPVAEGLARADALALMGADSSGVAEWLPPRLPVLHAALEPAATARTLAGETVFAFAGIGRPAKFRATLEELGCRIAGYRDFPDHHPYGAAEVEAVLKAASAAGAIPVTTEKDFVRLPPALGETVRPVGVRAVFREPGLLDELLQKVLPHG